MFTWHTIFDWLLKLISSIGAFGEWLFTRISFADATEGFITFVGKAVNSNPSHIQTIIDTIRVFFKDKAPSLLDWAEGVNFAPIDLIGITGLTIVVVMSFIKLYSIFS